MILDVWMESCDIPVGRLVRSADKSLTFTYDKHTPDHGRLSIAMPVREEPYTDATCLAFFGNLLFEGRELDRLVAVHGMDRDDIGGLLYHLGADCPGAVSVTPQGTGPGKRPGIFPDDYEELSQEKLAKIVQTLHFKGQLPDGSQDPSPVAGVQPKIAVVHVDGKFYLPIEGSRTPTTHILKVAPAKDPKLTHYENILLSLARELGISTTMSERIVFEDEETCSDIETILSTRFDRRIQQVHGITEIRRIHSEDFCQALGLSSELKYERNAVLDERKFCLSAVGGLMNKLSSPAAAKLEFLRHLVFNLLVGNTDNHAKNAAILYDRKAGSLAPLYDVVPVSIDTKVTHELSLLIGNARYAEDITSEAFMVAAQDLGFRGAKLPAKFLKLISEISHEAPSFIQDQGQKVLADAIAAQIEVVCSATGWDAPENTRDFHPRQSRDEDPEVFGWPGLG